MEAVGVHRSAHTARRPSVQPGELSTSWLSEGVYEEAEMQNREKRGKEVDSTGGGQPEDPGKRYLLGEKVIGEDDGKEICRSNSD